MGDRHPKIFLKGWLNMEIKLRKIIYMIILVVMTILSIPAMIVGTVLYILGALILAIVSKETIQNLMGMYLFVTEKAMETYKKNLLDPVWSKD